MLKITKSTGFTADPKETKGEVYGNNVVSSGKIINQKNSKNEKNQAKIAKSKNLVRRKNHNFSPNSMNMKIRPSFPTPEARLVFTKLRQVFIKASILYCFYLKCYIFIETDISEYAMSEILS